MHPLSWEGGAQTEKIQRRSPNKDLFVNAKRLKSRRSICLKEYHTSFCILVGIFSASPPPTQICLAPAIYICLNTPLKLSKFIDPYIQNRSIHHLINRFLNLPGNLPSLSVLINYMSFLPFYMRFRCMLDFSLGNTLDVSTQLFLSLFFAQMIFSCIDSEVHNICSL